MAYHHGLNILEKKLANHAVLDGALLRVAAASGLVATGMENIEEIDEIVDLFVVRGVRQEGTMTRLVAGYSADSQGNRMLKVTTSLHAAREEELVQLARASAEDRSGALNRQQLEDAIIETAIDFETTEHQRAQRAVMEKLAFGGRLSVAIGVAGSGKSTMILPLVRAWRKEGRTVWGAAIAWRQSADLSAAGIHEGHCLALSVFIDRVKNGGIKIGGDGILVIDELSTVPTMLLLETLRLQNVYKFRVVAIGDPRQCQSIEAGPVVDILKQALGTDAVPELLSTIRQKTEREQKTTLLFRDGRAAEALLAKREDGTARLIAGDYERVVSEIAQLWQERRKINQQNENWTISVSAPTNRDARAISLAIRKCRQVMGEVGPDMWNLSCCDLSGDAFDLTIGVGDRVRLFKRVNARCSDRSRGLLGNNGSVLEVIAIKPDGITLRNDKGRIGHVLWNTLRSEGGRILLSYGDVLTIDSSQGLTTSEHIEAMPAGTAGVNSFKAYTASSRHRSMTYLLASEGAERREITKRRPMGDTRRITESDVWDNIARNLSRAPETQGALAFLERSHRTRREAAVSMLSGLQRLEERRISAGLSLVANRFRQRRVARYMSTTVELLRECVEKLSHLTKALMLAAPASSVGGSRRNQAQGLLVRKFIRMPGPTYRM